MSAKGLHAPRHWIAVFRTPRTKLCKDDGGMLTTMLYALSSMFSCVITDNPKKDSFAQEQNTATAYLKQGAGIAGLTAARR